MYEYRITWQHVDGTERESRFDAKYADDAMALCCEEYGSNLVSVVKVVNTVSGEIEWQCEEMWAAEEACEIELQTEPLPLPTEEPVTIEQIKTVDGMARKASGDFCLYACAGLIVFRGSFARCQAKAAYFTEKLGFEPKLISYDKA